MMKTRLEQPQAGMKSPGLVFWDILASKEIRGNMGQYGAKLTLIRGKFGHPFFIQIRQGLNFWHPYTTLNMYPTTCVKQRYNPNRTT